MSLEAREKKERIEALDEKVSRMNAEAVVQTIKEMHLQMADFKEQLKQQANVIMLLTQRFETEKILAQQVAERGSGPTT